MLSIIEKNKYYFRLYTFFFTLLFLYQLTYYQSDALLFFSEKRSMFNDFFFKTMTRFGEEVAYIVLTALYLLRKERQKAVLVAIVGFTVLFLSPLFKMMFLHPRPYTVFEHAGILAKVNLVENYDILRGNSSFPSGHAMSGFALWSLLAFIYHKHFRLVTLFFIIAVLVALSRIYLFAHFPEDVLFGSALGVLVSSIIYGMFTHKSDKL
jgi:membrane-associated phospholipid phosphatase